MNWSEAVGRTNRSLEAKQAGHLAALCQVAKYVQRLEEKEEKYEKRNQRQTATCLTGDMGPSQAGEYC